MTTPNTDLTEQIENALWGSIRVYDHPNGRGADVLVHAPVHEVVAAVLPIVAEEVRKAKAEALDLFCNALADHIDLGTPRAWGFHHPCDSPGVRWEPTERDRALMDVADMIRNDTINPYHETGDSDEHR